jgi:hypothetical protein
MWAFVTSSLWELGTKLSSAGQYGVSGPSLYLRYGDTLLHLTPTSLFDSQLHLVGTRCFKTKRKRSQFTVAKSSLPGDKVCSAELSET